MLSKLHAHKKSMRKMPKYERERTISILFEFKNSLTQNGKQKQKQTHSQKNKKIKINELYIARIFLTIPLLAQVRSVHCVIVILLALDFFANSFWLVDCCLVYSLVQWNLFPRFYTQQMYAAIKDLLPTMAIECVCVNTIDFRLIDLDNFYPFLKCINNQSNQIQNACMCID